MTTTPTNLMTAATIDTVNSYGAALISNSALTQNLKATIEKCKYQYVEHESGDILVFNPEHPDFK